MADKDGSDLHKRVLGSLPSADFSCHDPESDVSLEFASVVIQRKWCKFGCRGSGWLSCSFILSDQRHFRQGRSCSVDSYVSFSFNGVRFYE